MAGSLSASNVIGDSTPVTLSASQYDWRQYEGAPSNPINVLAGGPGSISQIAAIGSPDLVAHHNDPRWINWTGGSVDASGSVNSGLRISCNANPGYGASFTVAADTTVRTLNVYWGTWDCNVTLMLSLSDSSAAPVSVDCPNSLFGNAESTNNSTISFSAASAGQTLLVQMVTYGNAGDADIYFQAAELDMPAGTTVALTGVSSTSAVGSVGAAITIALTGVGATGNAGSLASSTAIALPGVSSTSSAGALGMAASVGLSGNVSTGNVGTPGVQHGAALSGNAGAGAAGSVGISTSSTIMLTGVSGLGSAGSLSLPGALPAERERVYITSSGQSAQVVRTGSGEDAFIVTYDHATNVRIH